MSSMSPLAIVWLLLSAGGPSVDGDQAAATAPAPAIEIVLAGPRESRAKMETAIRAVAGSDIELGWSNQDSLPNDMFSPGRAPDGKSGVASGPRASRIWLDMCAPAEVRIYMPAAEPRGALMVRTVWRPEGDAEDGDRVAREEVAQIVKTAVLALQKRSTPEVPPPAAVVARDSGISVARSLPVSVLLGGGVHTSPWNLSNGIGRDHWLGPSWLAAGRWQVQHLQLGLRLAWERSEVDGYRYNIKSDLLSGTLAIAYRLQWTRLSLSLGVQAGVLVLRQKASPTLGAENLSQQPGETSAAGPIAGPVLEMDLAVSRRVFLHLDAAFPVGAMRIDDGVTRRWYASGYVQTTLGLGFCL
jgi:hypothetical protein